MSDIDFLKKAEPADGDVDAGTVVLYGDSSTNEIRAKDGDTKNTYAVGDDKKGMVSANDTIPGFLEDKIISDGGVTVDVINEGGNEKLRISSSVLANLNPTGVVFAASGIITINGVDDSTYDHTEIKYFIKGIFYTLAASTGVDASFGAGSNTSFVGVDSSGLVYSGTLWTNTQLKTILPVARLGAASGETGPGSTISLIRDDRFFIDEQNFNLRNWMEHAFGALYHTGGVITKSATALQLDQSAGTLFDAQGKEQTLAQDSDFAGLKVFHTGGVPTTAAADPLIVDTANYDNGTDLTAIPSNKWVCHTLLKSPKGSPQEGGFFFVYADTIYNNQTEAEQAPVDFSIFTDQHTSGLTSVARIIVQQGAAVITTVLDERPFAVGGAGGATASSTPTMQQVYESSTVPQINLNSTQGLLEIRDASTPLGTGLFAIANSAGSTIYFKASATTISAPLPTYADDAAAGTGGLVANDFYKTSTGEMRIKL